MRIVFKPFGPLRAVCGSSEIPLEFDGNVTVGDVVRKLIDIYGHRLAELILSGNQLSGNLIVMVNKRDVNTLQGMETVVRDGDEVAILPHVQGGGG